MGARAGDLQRPWRAPAAAPAALLGLAVLLQRASFRRRRALPHPSWCSPTRARAAPLPPSPSPWRCMLRLADAAALRRCYSRPSGCAVQAMLVCSAFAGSPLTLAPLHHLAAGAAASGFAAAVTGSRARGVGAGAVVRCSGAMLLRSLGAAVSPLQFDAQPVESRPPQNASCAPLAVRGASVSRGAEGFCGRSGAEKAGAVGLLLV